MNLDGMFSYCPQQEAVVVVTGSAARNVPGKFHNLFEWEK
jgi:hypothetical protein